MNLYFYQPELRVSLGEVLTHLDIFISRALKEGETYKDMGEHVDHRSITDARRHLQKIEKEVYDYLRECGYNSDYYLDENYVEKPIVLEKIDLTNKGEK
jgi:AraC-like DNA-binding protein